jgi:hypothetical protein
MFTLTCFSPFASHILLFYSFFYRCDRNNSHISWGITNKWYEVSPKTYFPNVDVTKFFYFRFSKLYRPNGGRDGRYTFGAVLLEWTPLVGPRTEDDV